MRVEGGEMAAEMRTLTTRPSITPERKPAFPGNPMLENLFATTAKILPCAAGLEKVFLIKAHGKLLTASAPYIELNDHVKLVCYKVLLGDKEMGTVEIRYYEIGEITITGHIMYKGKIPGYKNEEPVALLADERRIITLPYFEPPLLATPNNTPENKLYRHDGHFLMPLADYETSGSGRQ